MDTLKIVKKDIVNGEYQGDISDFDGHVEIDAGLGFVLFKKIKITGYLYAKAGSGIEAGWAPYFFLQSDAGL